MKKKVLKRDSAKQIAKKATKEFFNGVIHGTIVFIAVGIIDKYILKEGDSE